MGASVVISSREDLLCGDTPKSSAPYADFVTIDVGHQRRCDRDGSDAGVCRSLGLTLVMLAAGLRSREPARPAQAGLDEYVKKPDTAFAWSKTNKLSTPAGTITTLGLTSQVWQGITWKHELTVYEPRELTHADAMLLFITGGDHNSKQNDNDHKQGFGLAQLCGRASLYCARFPTNPCLDGKTEDELIAETFVRYLKTKDENWPLLFPMVKSAVRALDALQAFGQGNRQAGRRDLS